MSPNYKKSIFNGQIPLDKLKLNQKSYYTCRIQHFEHQISMESQPQNPEFRSNPENFNQWTYYNAHCQCY